MDFRHEIYIWKFFVSRSFLLVLCYNATVSDLSGINFEELKITQLMLSASLLGDSLQQAD